MSRQPEPSVVRPLRELAVNEVVPLIRQSPEAKTMFVMRNFINANDVVGNLYVTREGSLEIILIGCNIVQSDETTTLVDASNVSDTILVKQCPCYSNYERIEDLQIAGDAVMQRLCEGTDITPDMLIVELKEEEWSDWGNRRIEYVIEL